MPRVLVDIPVRVTTLLCICVALLLLAACSPDAPEAQLRRLGPDATILAFGDSLTFGTGAAADQSYPVVLEGLSGIEVIRSGVPGETTREGLERLPGVLDRVEPDLVILCLGGNDMLRRQDRGAMKQNLAKMIELIRERGIEVALLGVPEPAVFGLEIEPSYLELARQYNAPLETEALSEILSDESRKADQIHPNASGYADLARAVLHLLQRSGALP